ncbi:MAG: hypothetical protein DMF81_01090 [Acidobacteria bacterium]|nr:MAG: hypothetical protein DMF81_01090 [Acidobacteriota bacterium]
MNDLPGTDRVLMISHRFWQTRFGGDAHVIGRIVRVNGEAHDIVGVLPATLNDWRHLGLIDLFRPLALTEQETRDRSTIRGRRAPSKDKGGAPIRDRGPRPALLARGSVGNAAFRPSSRTAS